MKCRHGLQHHEDAILAACVALEDAVLAADEDGFHVRLWLNRGHPTQQGPWTVSTGFQGALSGVVHYFRVRPEVAEQKDAPEDKP